LSGVEAAMAEQKIASVEVSALVVLRIAKHCNENFPDPVTGPLLGLDEGPLLYATDCFGYPQKLDDDDDGDGSRYQAEMLRALRDVNVDCNIIGWYQTTSMGSFMNEILVETQYLYQNEIPTSVVIIYDPLQTSVGKGAFKAFRLTKEFMQKEKKFRDAKEDNPGAPVASSEIFEEVPLKIVNSVLVDAFLLGQDRRNDAAQFDMLDLENQTFLEKNLAFLLDSLEYLGSEQQKMQYYERMAVKQAQQQKSFIEKRRQENVLRRERGEDLLAEAEGPAFKRAEKGSQVETILISSQISTYCSQIQDFAGESFSKVFLVGGAAA
jgi:translation initiation factor 3 subunit H